MIDGLAGVKMKSNSWALVARLGGIGDNLIAASVLRPLKRMGYMTEMLTGEGNHVVYHYNPFVDKLSVKGPHDIPEGDIAAWQRWFENRSHEYDLFAHLSHSCEARHAFFPHMTQFWWRPEYRRTLCAGSYLETAHDIAGVPYEFGPLFFPSEDEKDRAVKTKAKIGPLCVGWILAGSRIDKVYADSSLVIARIIKELGIPVMMFGAHAKQFEMGKTIMDLVVAHNSTHADLHLCMSPTASDPGGNFNWPLRRILTQLLQCDLVISPDTGPAWATAFEPMPKILLTSHASADNITKHWKNTITLTADNERVPCQPCHRLHDVPETCVMSKAGNSAACMADISVELMMTAIKAALGDNESFRSLQSNHASQIVLRDFVACPTDTMVESHPTSSSTTSTVASMPEIERTPESSPLRVRSKKSKRRPRTKHARTTTRRRSNGASLST